MGKIEGNFHVFLPPSSDPAEPPDDDDTVKAAFQFCKVRSKSIEINYQNMDGDKILTKVNFQFDPVVRREERGKRDVHVSS